jgi:hypothetical protein
VICSVGTGDSIVIGSNSIVIESFTFSGFEQDNKAAKPAARQMM